MPSDNATRYLRSGNRGRNRKSYRAIKKQGRKRDIHEEKFSRFVKRVLDACRLFVFDGVDESELSPRNFTGRYCSTTLDSEVSNIQRQLDVLISKDPISDPKTSRAGWKMVDAFGELKAVESPAGTDARGTEHYFRKDVEPELQNYAYCIFESQEDRRYIPCFSLAGTDARLSIYDRSGVIHSSCFSTLDYTFPFFHLLLGFAYIPDEYLGYDLSITSEPDKLRTVTVAGVQYQIESTIYRSVMITGRATTFWLARDPEGKLCVIKDAWIKTTRGQTEVNFLKLVNELDIKGVCQMIAYEDVMVNGRLDSTDLNRGLQSGLEDRLHRRIVFKHALVPLTRFKSLKELLSIFKDCLIGMYWSYYLHFVLIVTLFDSTLRACIKSSDTS